MTEQEIHNEIMKVSTRHHNLPTPNEYQLSFMKTCDKCKYRKRFKMQDAKGKVTEHDWCDEIYSYVKPNTIYLQCSRYNKPYLYKREPLWDKFLKLLR